MNAEPSVEFVSRPGCVKNVELSAAWAFCASVLAVSASRRYAVASAPRISRFFGLAFAPDSSVLIAAELSFFCCWRVARSV